jgi:hypothetical protein
MTAIFTNWKTSLLGVAAILTALAAVASQTAHGTLDMGAMMQDYAAIAAGVGMLFAKDGNK